VGAQLPAFGMIAVAALITGDMNGLEIRPETCSEDRSHDFAKPMGQRLSETARSQGLFRKPDAAARRERVWCAAPDAVASSKFPFGDPGSLVTYRWQRGILTSRTVRSAADGERLDCRVDDPASRRKC